MKIAACGISHTGYRREKNEDTFYLNGRVVRGAWPSVVSASTRHPVLLGVFDGMGGIRAGERASYLAMQAACDAHRHRIGRAEEWVPAVCRAANDAVCAEMRQTNVRMGTTASMLCFTGDDVVLCNIGDSPIFLFCDGKLTEISHAHTERENFVQLYGEEAVPPGKKFRLTQHIGIFPQEMEIEPYVTREPLRAGDRFLICSDGLTDMVPEAAIAATMAQGLSPRKTAQSLLNQALLAGGKDNVTVVCADVKKTLNLMRTIKG